ncbi:hypothetical protein DVA86_20490 [Streptomyces armeniacus]|uniref:DUF6919 domain-containing protein n=1 Tax=Streptomyces armeniacus TaxID=83291 RepID=A0A345XSQ7_9ACTN|nr:hypothetical protein [Streptomyces armeniacus]AXK34673.1 hypothetical protein DVA86_20490 [Streptomyces armeniacus]
MSRADRKRWRAAHTLSDLGDLMARWLERDIKSWPGYQPGYGPEEETNPAMIRVLAQLNRAGYLTVDSQPGITEPDDGVMWSQRASVTGFVDEDELVARLEDMAAEHDLRIVLGGRAAGRVDEDVVLTTRDGQPHSVFPGYLGHGELRCMWPGVSFDAFGALMYAWQVTIYAPEWGASGQRLWDALEGVVGAANPRVVETEKNVPQLRR